MSRQSNRTTLAHAYREQVLWLFNRKCLRCPATTDLQVHLLFNDYGAHHKFGSGRRWKFYLECVRGGDAELLCRRCHQRAEQLKRVKQKELGSGAPGADARTRPRVLLSLVAPTQTQPD